MNNSIVTDDFQGVLDKFNTLLENNLHLISFKHFVDTNYPEKQIRN